MKALIFLTAIVIFILGGVVFFSEPNSMGQEAAPPSGSNIEKEFDARLRDAESKTLLLENKPVEKKVIVKPRVVYIPKPVPVQPKSEMAYFIKDSSIVLDMELERRDGLLFVDIDKFERAVAVQDSIHEQPGYDFRDTIMKVADEEIRGWKKIKSWFKRSKNQ